MGYYLNEDQTGKPLNATGKAQQLIACGAQPIAPPTEHIPNLVCVVSNGLFEAAGYAYCPEEMNAFNLPNDTRPKQWLIVENADIISGYKKSH